MPSPRGKSYNVLLTERELCHSVFALYRYADSLALSQPGIAADYRHTARRLSREFHRGTLQGLLRGLVRRLVRRISAARVRRPVREAGAMAALVETAHMDNVLRGRSDAAEQAHYERAMAGLRGAR
jgi:hypothetical protein